ncbi:hypothetical protein [Microscilla marina]|uniref:Uncharacterized protein n=1 Tax=Microscilla marina ATCC 23134 TaxID=313606 RepID=A1ZXQ4_MICM2|nr:hypothetical protein [Microscilla marina]EAY24832.1 hypothetical protein M23134_06724 [Microscilla marina ATCC 23134]
MKRTKFGGFYCPGKFCPQPPPFAPAALLGWALLPDVLEPLVIKGLGNHSLLLTDSQCFEGMGKGWAAK